MDSNLMNIMLDPPNIQISSFVKEFDSNRHIFLKCTLRFQLFKEICGFTLIRYLWGNDYLVSSLSIPFL